MKHSIQKLIPVSVVIAILAIFVAFPVQPTQAAPAVTMTVTSVVANSLVTIRFTNLPAKSDFHIWEGAAGTHGVNGVLVAGISTTTGGTAIATFEIAKNLGNNLDIGLETGGNIIAYVTIPNSSTPLVPAVTMTILLPVTGGQVTILFTNLPANTDFGIREGPAGTHGANGVLIATMTTTSGGTHTATFEIARNLGSALDIGLEMNGSIIAYVTIGSSSTPAASAVGGAFPSSGGVGGLSVSVLSVDRNNKFTVQISGLASDDATYTVREGPAGSRGFGGPVIAHFDSGDGGQRNYTFEVVTSLYNTAAVDVLIYLDSQHYAWTRFSNN